MPFSDDEELLTEAELSKWAKRSRRQLDRANRRGFPYVEIEGQIRYLRGHARSHIARNLVSPTVEARENTLPPAAETLSSFPAVAVSQPHRHGRPPKRPRRHEGEGAR